MVTAQTASLLLLLLVVLLHRSIPILLLVHMSMILLQTRLLFLQQEQALLLTTLLSMIVHTQQVLRSPTALRHSLTLLSLLFTARMLILAMIRLRLFTLYFLRSKLRLKLLFSFSVVSRRWTSVVTSRLHTANLVRLFMLSTFLTRELLRPVLLLTNNNNFGAGLSRPYFLGELMVGSLELNRGK